MNKNNDKEIDLIAFVRQLKWRKLLKWGIIGFAAGIVIALSIPREFTTIIEFAPESNNQQTSLASSGALGALSSMAGLGTIPSADGVNMTIYPRIAHSTPFLMEFYDMPVPTDHGMETLSEYLEKDIKLAWWSHIFKAPGKVLEWMKGGEDTTENDPYHEAYALSKNERRFRTAMINRTGIEIDKKTGTARISAVMQNPIVAAVVTDSMMTTLQRYMTAYFQTKAKTSLESTEKLHNEAFEDYKTAQRVYAEASDVNRGLITETGKIRLEKLRNEYQVSYSVYERMAVQLAMTKLKLQEDNHIATIIEPAKASGKSSSTSRMTTVIVWTLLFVAGYVIVVFIIDTLSLFKISDQETEKTCQSAD